MNWLLDVDDEARARLTRRRHAHVGASSCHIVPSRISPDRIAEARKSSWKISRYVPRDSTGSRDTFDLTPVRTIETRHRSLCPAGDKATVGLNEVVRDKARQLRATMKVTTKDT